MYTELSKLIKSKNFYISIICLTLIVVLSVFTGVINHYENVKLLSSIYKDSPEIMAFVSPHKEWPGLSMSNFFSSLYYFLYPLIISIALVDSIYNERKYWNINFILVRMNKIKYYIYKFLFTYIMSFIIFILPLLFGILLINLFTFHWDYSNYSINYKGLIEETITLPDDSFIGDKKTIFSNLLIKSPYFYILIYYFLAGTFAGLYVCIGLAFSLIFKNQYLIVFMPQIVYTGLWLIFTVFGKLTWDPFNFLDPKQPIVGLSLVPIPYIYLSLLSIALIIYIYGVRKNSDLF